MRTNTGVLLRGVAIPTEYLEAGMVRVFVVQFDVNHPADFFPMLCPVIETMVHRKKARLSFPATLACIAVLLKDPKTTLFVVPFTAYTAISEVSLSILSTPLRYSMCGFRTSARRTNATALCTRTFATIDTRWNHR